MPDALAEVRAAVRAALDGLVAAGGAPGGLVGVACSGGADSMALADAALAVAGPARVVVLTIDHGLRPGAAGEADAVAAWARSQGARAVVRRVVVRRGASLEAAARAARYQALEELAEAHGLAAVLLGHTARDQAETVLLRLLRGTGPAGLAAMAPRRGRYLRPLLALPRATTAAYAARRGLPVQDDPMNDDPRHARVRVRRDLIPRLAAENPGLEEALCRLARASAEWREVIDAAAAPLARLPLDCPALAGHPAAVRKRALALALEDVGLALDGDHLDRLDALVRAPRRGTVALDLPGGRVERRWDELVLAAPVAAAGRAPDGAAPPAGYALRTWRPGDRMRPARRGGRSRKLSDLFAEARVPRAARAGARVLERGGAIAWAEHVGWAAGEAPAPGWPPDDDDDDDDDARRAAATAPRGAPRRDEP